MARTRRGATKQARLSTEQVDPLTLKLDTKNPRFAAYGPGGRLRERDVIANLIESADLRELIDSIAANGYVDIEPLVVLEERRGELTVIEGNRRVAAIKLLRLPELAAELGVTLPPVRPSLQASFTRATILRVSSREEARQYIGFKHINGPHKWDSFAKAKFAADWYRSERATGITLRDIAHRLGDRHDTVLRLVHGMYVLEQASASNLFTPDERFPGRPFAFSHLYTALTRPAYRAYLGLELNWRQIEPTPDPVPQQVLPRLKQILIWLYGSAADEKPPLVTSQNPHIKQLGEVLENPLALKRLEATNELSKAYAEVETRGRKFEESLIRAVRHAEDAQQYVDGYDGDAALAEYAARLTKIGQGLQRAIKGIAPGLDR
jgi:hypothetical protein